MLKHNAIVACRDPTYISPPLGRIHPHTLAIIRMLLRFDPEYCKIRRFPQHQAFGVRKRRSVTVIVTADCDC